MFCTRPSTSTPPPLLLLSERKLIFVVDMMRSCKALHDEGVRRAASDSSRGVHPYTVSHHMLEPASASTRWDLRVHNRVELMPGSTNESLQPLRAKSMPLASERPSSDHIYSGGVSAARLEAPDIEAQALQVRQVLGLCAAPLRGQHAHPPPPFLFPSVPL